MTNPSSNNGTVTHAARPPIKLPLGQLLATPGAIDAMIKAGQNAAEFLQRHARGDWGIVGAEDWAANDHAVDQQERILSAYLLKSGVRIWIITETDRVATTILLPDEY